MSTIFNVFNNTNEHNRILTGEHMKDAKLSGCTSGIITKKVEQYKPKGLSLRSKSDLNIPTNSFSTPLKKNDSKDSFFSKSEQKQLLQLPKNLIKTDTSEINKEKVFEENVFKEPYGVERISRKMFPEPEVLAPYYDPQVEFDDIDDEAFENEFHDYMVKLQDDTDEGFASGAEELPYPEISILHLSYNFSDDEYENHGSPALPQISDDETPWLE